MKIYYKNHEPCYECAGQEGKLFVAPEESDGVIEVDDSLADNFKIWQDETNRLEKQIWDLINETEVDGEPVHGPPMPSGWLFDTLFAKNPICDSGIVHFS